MRLETRHLRVIVTVADTGSISAAARHLRVAQPTLTTQLRRIEDTCGFTLFERHVAGVRPTDPGRGVLRQARIILAQLAELTAAPRTPPPVRAVRLATSVEQLDLATVVRRFPDVVWTITRRSRDDAARSVQRGTDDLAICLRWPCAPKPAGHVVAHHELYRGPMRLLLPAGESVAGGGAVALRSYADRPWVVRSDPDARRAVLVECDRAGFVPEIRFCVDDPATLAELVGAGAGVAMEPVLRPVAGTVAEAYRGAAEFRCELQSRVGGLAADLAAAVRSAFHPTSGSLDRSLGRAG